MIKLLFLIPSALLLTACVNKRGISTKYYNNCREYYDVQGVYHNACDENEIVEYETLKNLPQKAVELFDEEESPKNVW